MRRTARPRAPLAPLAPLAAVALLAPACAEPRRAEAPAGVAAAPVSGYIVQDGSGPAPFRVADQERLAAALPACRLAALRDRAPAAVRLRPPGARGATLRLPDAGAAADGDVPDSTWQAWDWPDGATLVVSVHRRPVLPGLYGLEGPGPGGCRLWVAGRPMSVGFRAEPARRGTRYHASVSGFLDDTTDFFAGVTASSEGRRDPLLAAVGTLAPAPPAGR